MDPAYELGDTSGPCRCQAATKGAAPKAKAKAKAAAEKPSPKVEELWRWVAQWGPWDAMATVCYSMLPYGTVWYSMVQYGRVHFNKASCSKLPTTRKGS